MSTQVMVTMEMHMERRKGPMTIDDQIRRMAGCDIPKGHHADDRDDEEALRRFTAAAQLIDSDPDEARRIRTWPNWLTLNSRPLTKGWPRWTAAMPTPQKTSCCRRSVPGSATPRRSSPSFWRKRQMPPRSSPSSGRVAGSRADRVILNAAYQRSGESLGAHSGWRSLLRRSQSKLWRQATATIKVTPSTWPRY